MDHFMEKEAIKQKVIIMKSEVMLDDLGDPQTRSADNSGLLVEQNIKKVLSKWFRWFWTKNQR